MMDRDGIQFTPLPEKLSAPTNAAASCNDESARSAHGRLRRSVLSVDRTVIVRRRRTTPGSRYPGPSIDDPPVPWCTVPRRHRRCAMPGRPGTRRSHLSRRSHTTSLDAVRRDAYAIGSSATTHQTIANRVAARRCGAQFTAADDVRRIGSALTCRSRAGGQRPLFPERSHPR